MSGSAGTPARIFLDCARPYDNCTYMAIGQPKSISACRRFFLEPSSPKQRQYEALRAYFAEGRASAEAARAFGYTTGSFQVLCHRFRREKHPPSSWLPSLARACSPRKPPGAT